MVNEEEKPESQAGRYMEQTAWHTSQVCMEGKSLLAEWCGWVSWLLPVPAPTQLACLV